MEMRTISKKYRKPRSRKKEESTVQEGIGTLCGAEGGVVGKRKRPAVTNGEHQRQRDIRSEFMQHEPSEAIAYPRPREEKKGSNER